MKNWLKEALKKTGCIGLAVAMLVCSFPLQTVATTVETEEYLTSETAEKVGTGNDGKQTNGILNSAESNTGSGTESIESDTETETTLPEDEVSIKIDEVTVSDLTYKQIVSVPDNGKCGYDVKLSGTVIYSVIGAETSDETAVNSEKEKYRLILTLKQQTEEGQAAAEPVQTEQKLSDGDTLEFNTDVTVEKNVKLSWQMDVYKNEVLVASSVPKEQILAAEDVIHVNVTNVTMAQGLKQEEVQYIGGTDGGKGYFQASLSVSAEAEFGSDVLSEEELSNRMESELGRYTLTIGMKKPSEEEYVKVATENFVLSLDDKTKIIVNGVGLENYRFDESGLYSWYAVVKKDGVELQETKRFGSQEVKIPEAIGISFSELKVDEATGQPGKVTSDTGKVTAFDLSGNITGNVMLTGLYETVQGDAGEGKTVIAVSAQDRLEELKSCLHQKKLEIQVAGVDDGSVSVALDDNSIKGEDSGKTFAEQLLGSEGYSAAFTYEYKVETKKAGAYRLAAKITGEGQTDPFITAETEEKSIPYEKQTLKYTVGDGNDTFLRGEKIAFTPDPTGQKVYNEISCFESDKNGNEISPSEDAHVSIEKETDGEYQVTGKKAGNCWITFDCAGNDIYERVTKTYPIVIEKEKLTGTISVCSVQKKILVLSLADQMQITVELTTDQAEIFKNYYENIDICFKAVPKDASASEGESAGIELGTVSGGAAKWNEESGSASYEYEIPAENLEKLAEDGLYTIQAELLYTGNDELGEQYEPLTLSYEDFCKSNVTPYIEMEAQGLRYGKADQKLNFSVYAKKGDRIPIDAEELTYSYVSSNTGVIEIENDGTMKAKRGGSSQITVTATPKDTSDLTGIGSSKRTVTVTVLPPEDSGYTINDVSAGALADLADAVLEGEGGKQEYWFDNEIIIKPSSSAYNEIGVRKAGGSEEDWEYHDVEWKIGVSLPTDYEFYFRNTELELSSRDGYETDEGGENRKGVKTISGIGVAAPTGIDSSKLSGALEKIYYYDKSKKENGYKIAYKGSVNMDPFAGEDIQTNIEKNLSRYKMSVVMTVEEEGCERKEIKQTAVLSTEKLSVETDLVQISHKTNMAWKISVYKTCHEGDRLVAELESDKTEQIEMPQDVTVTITGGSALKNANCTYVYDPNGDKRYFTNDFWTDVTASFENGTVLENPRLEEKKEELSKYSIKLTITDSEGNICGDPVEGKLELDENDSDKIIVTNPKIEGFQFTESGKYTETVEIMKSVGAGFETVKSNTSDIDITIPEAIEVEIGDPKLECGTVSNENANGVISSYDISANASVSVKLNNVESSAMVSEEERRSEIEHCLDGKTLKLAWKTDGGLIYRELGSSDLKNETFINELLESALYEGTFTYSGSVRAESAGTYYFKAELDGKKTAESDIREDPRVQEFDYEVPNGGKLFVGETYVFSLKSGSKVLGNANCYVTDEAGKNVTGKAVEISGVDKNGTFSVTCNSAGKYTVHVEWSGNEIYESTEHQYTINIQKSQLEGNLEVYSTSTNISIFGYVIHKKKKLEIKAGIHAKYNNKKLLEGCYRKLIATAYLVPESGGEAIELGNLTRKDGECIGGEYIYRCEIAQRKLDRVMGNRKYTVKVVFSNSEPETFPYEDLELLQRDLEVQNITPSIDAAAQTVEYGVNDQALSFAVYEDAAEKTEPKSGVSCQFQSSNPEIVDIDENGILTPKSGGTAQITITVDDKANGEETADRYNEASKVVDVTVTSPKNVSYTINDKTRAEFLAGTYQVSLSNGVTEYWSKDEVTIAPGEGSLYNEVVYSKDGGEWESTGADKALVIDKTLPADYKFYFCNKAKNLCSYDKDGSCENVDGGLQLLPKLAVGLYVNISEPIMGSLTKQYFYDENEGKNGYAVSVSGSVPYDFGEKFPDWKNGLTEEEVNAALSRYKAVLSLYDADGKTLLTKTEPTQLSAATFELFIQDFRIYKNTDIKWELSVYENGTGTLVANGETLENESVIIPDPLAVDAGISSVTDGGVSLKYVSSPDGKDRHFEASILASAAADFSAGIIPDDERIKEKKLELSRYKLRLVMESPSRKTTETELPFVLDENDSNEIIIDTAELKDYKFTETGSYKWRASVLKDGTELSGKTVEKAVVIPDPIQLVTGELKLESDYTKNPLYGDSEDKEKITAYEVPITVSADVTVKGIDASNVAAEKRLPEIAYQLGQKELSLQENGKSIWDRGTLGKVKLDADNFAAKLIQSKDYCAKFSRIFGKDTNIIDEAGTYGYQAVLRTEGADKNQTKDLEIEVVPIAQNYDYKCKDMGAENSFIIGETYLFDLEVYDKENKYGNTRLYDNGTCYESDENGNAIDNNPDFEITQKEDGSYGVRAMKIGTYYVSFHWDGNKIYDEECRTYKVQVGKADLAGNISVYSTRLEKKFLGITFKKENTLHITVDLQADQSDLLEQYYESIGLRFIAVCGNETKELGSIPAKKDFLTKKNVSFADGTATYEYDVPVDLADALVHGSKYNITAVMSFDETFPYHDRSLTFKGLTAENITPYIELEAQQVEYGTTRKLEFEVYDVKGDAEQTPDKLLNCEVEVAAEDRHILEVEKKEDGAFVLHPLEGGFAELTVFADDADNSKKDRYNVGQATIKIEVLSPQNTDYTINGTTKEEFLANADAVISEGGEKEYWYKDNFTISLGADNLYDEIVYRKKGGEWKNAGANLEIGESSVTDYEFYFCDTEKNLYSYDWKTEENIVPDARKTLEDVGVDETSPDFGTMVAADKKAASHSTDEIHYFSDNVSFSVYAEGTLGAEKAIDGGTGIEKLYVRYGASDWQELSDFSQERRYTRDYTISLTENKRYGTLQIKAVDYLGHESRTAEYRGAYGTETIDTSFVGAAAAEICIDKVHPIIKAIPYQADAQGTLSSYGGEWTNHQLQYLMELETDQTSGIYNYQYAFVPRGTEFNAQNVSWIDVSPEKMKVVFGTLMGEKAQNTYASDFSYKEDGAGQKTAQKPDAYAQKNGVIYFRAESNASLLTEEKEIRDSKQQVRIWQENINNPTVSADNHCDAATGWYNRKTGAVKLTFAYPEYKASEYAPAVGVVYEFRQKTLTEDVTVKKKFYKGILDEGKGTVTETTDYRNPQSKTSLSEQGTLYIDRDSVNELVVYTEDAAGNRSDKAVYTVKADYIAPDQMKMIVDGVEQVPHTSLGDRIIYNSFSQENVTVEGVVDYGISGKQNLYMMKCKNLGDWSDLSGANTDGQVVMAPCTRGFVYMYAADGAGNTADSWSNGIATDNLPPVGPDNMDISIQAFGANSRGFFNQDFKVSVGVTDAPAGDDYSGLKSVTYTVGNGESDTQRDVGLYHFDKAEPIWEDLMGSAGFSTDNVTVSAFENEGNEAYMRVTAVDNAGNTKTVSQVFMIDVTKPKIDVSFDKTNESESKYYNTDRVATVQITELNFDPELVKFTIQKDGEVIDSVTPSKDSWVSQGGNVHTANIIFHEDGDYTFTVECSDMADNSAEYDKVEEFTVDQTKPVAEVTYDNENAWKDNYFNAPRTATITVEEHNFDEKAFEASVSPQVSLSSWSHSGDVHKATLGFQSDEHYTYTISCTDLAGNEMEPFEEEEFYIDTEEPELQITGVEDQSANGGDVVPVVIASDTNFDENGINITLTNSKGKQIQVSQQRTASAEGYAYKLTNVNEQPDEIYTLTVKGTDMAGNESELSYRFSLNRHGSTYDLSDMSGLIKKVYTRFSDMGDLHIIETNVDKIEEFTVYISRNGELLADSPVNTRPGTPDENKIYYATDVSGDDALGYQYNYTIYKENFRQEGVYNIILYSKDRAGNEVNNTLTDKGAEITFVVDNTKPTVVIEGVSAGEFYAEDSKDVNVYTSDNFRLKEANFYLTDEKGNTVQTYNYMELAEEDGQVVTLTLSNSDKKQSLLYHVADAAGNEAVSSQESQDAPVGFMITTNAWFRFINNKKAVAAAVAGTCTVGAAGAGGTALIRRRKRRSMN